MTWLNYHHLYYFWLIRREGSLTAASEKLRLAPSTVSSQLATLEESLNGKLFRRSGRKLVLTDLGQLVYRYADEIFSLGSELMNEIQGRTGSSMPSFRVGVVDVIPKLVTCRILEPFFDLPGKTQLICREAKEEKLLADLALHQLDVVLTDTPLRPGMNIKAYNHLLGDSGVSFFAAPALAASLEGEFPQCLDGAPMLVPMNMTAVRMALNQWLDKTGVEPVIVGEFDDSALLKVFGQTGRGVFIAPTIIEQEVMQQYQTVIVGRTSTVREKFYAISVERIIRHPAVACISASAQARLFSKSRQSP